MKHLRILSLFCFLFAGCDSGVMWEDETYEVRWIDTAENSHVFYKLENGNGIGRIEPTILAIGNNAEYLVAKRYSNTGVVDYYYIIKAVDVDVFDVEVGTRGPFDEATFLLLTTELNLPPFELTFD